MREYLRWLLGWDRPAFGRAPGWAAVRKAHLEAYPRCAACGTRKNVVPHHKEPVSISPEKELEPGNLLSLCDGPGGGCHRLIGHLSDFRSWNPAVEADAAWWLTKVQCRPRVPADDVDLDS